MSDYYTESQMQRIEQAAYDGATLEAGKEWERQRYEFDATEAKLVARIAELEAERDQAKAIVSRLRDFLFDYTQFHISTNPEERWWALVDKFDELVKERER